LTSSGWLKFLWIVSIRSLLRSPRRTLISLLSIAAAAAAILIFQSFGEGISVAFRYNVIRSIYGHFSVTKKGFENDDLDNPFAYQIENPDALRAAITKDVGPVRFFGPRQSFYGLISYNDRSYGGSGWGVDALEEKKFLTLMQVTQGKHLADADEQSLFVASGLAKKLRLKVGDLSTLMVTTARGSINAVDLEVIGIYETGITELDRGTFLVHQSILGTLLDVAGTHEILIGFDDDQEVALQKPLAKMLAEKFPDLQAKHWRQRAKFYDNSMAWINQQIYVFRLIVLLIATLSIVNVFTMGLMERTGEFGTLRAIGTHRREITAMIFGESMVQAVVGSLAGVVLGLFIILVLLKNGVTMPPPPLLSVPFHVNFMVPWRDVPMIAGLCIVVAGGAGILPAIRIARMNIVKALGRNV